MQNLLIVLAFVLMLPFLLMIFLVVAIPVYFLIRFNIIKTPFSNMMSNHQFANNFKEQFTQKISCKHQNLEQREQTLICSDCGKIIQHG